MLFGLVKMTYFHSFFQTTADVLTMERPIGLRPTRLNCISGATFISDDLVGLDFSTAGALEVVTSFTAV